MMSSWEIDFEGGFGGTIQGALVRHATNGAPRNQPVPWAAVR